MTQAETLALAERHCTMKGRRVCRVQPGTPRSRETGAGASGCLWEGFVCWQAVHFPWLPDNGVHGHFSEQSCSYCRGNSSSSTSWRIRKAVGVKHPLGRGKSPQCLQRSGNASGHPMASPSAVSLHSPCGSPAPHPAPQDNPWGFLHRHGSKPRCCLHQCHISRHPSGLPPL